MFSTYDILSLTKMINFLLTGQFFAMKYKVLYGIPTAIAEFDGMKMPPLPTCPSHMHRYSALWREFDAGLYRFLVK